MHSKKVHVFDYANSRDLVPGTIFQHLVRRPLNFWMRRGMNLHLEGLNLLNLDPRKPYIFAANHIHELDGLLWPALFTPDKHPFPIHPVTARKGFYSDKGVRGKLYDSGLLFYLMGAFPLSFSSDKKFEEILQNQIRLLNDGYSILIFPQGKVGNPDEFDPASFKSGVAFLSYHTGAEVVPFATTGNYRQNLLKSAKARKSPLIIRFGELWRSQSTDFKKEAEDLGRIIQQMLVNHVDL